MEIDNAAEALMWRADAGAYEREFTALVHRQSRFVFRVAYSVLRNTADAEDAGQEAFLKLYRTRTWREANDERAFLARAVWRLAVEKSRRVKRDRMSQPAAAVEDELTPERLSAAADMSAYVHRLIDALPDELRHPLALSTVEELNSTEIGKILGIPEGTVRSRLSRAREILKQKAANALERRT